MFILGLTGSIGMGKSETARMFRRLGVAVFDADAAVATLYGPGGEAVPLIEQQFPGCTSDGSVDRAKLSTAVLGRPEALKRLESIVHPLVYQARMRFLADQADKGTPVVVLDIPLLYETGGEKDVDAVLVVSAPAEVQRARVHARPGMTKDAFEAILARQTPDAEKRERADFVVDTGRGLDYAYQQVKRVLGLVRTRKAHIWDVLRTKTAGEAR